MYRQRKALQCYIPSQAGSPGSPANGEGMPGKQTLDVYGINIIKYNPLSDLKMGLKMDPNDL